MICDSAIKRCKSWNYVKKQSKGTCPLVWQERKEFFHGRLWSLFLCFSWL